MTLYVFCWAYDHVVCLHMGIYMIHYMVECSKTSYDYLIAVIELVLHPYDATL